MQFRFAPRNRPETSSIVHTFKCVTAKKPPKLKSNVDKTNKSKNEIQFHIYEMSCDSDGNTLPQLTCPLWQLSTAAQFRHEHFRIVKKQLSAYDASTKHQRTILLFFSDSILGIYCFSGKTKLNKRIPCEVFNFSNGVYWFFYRVVRI